MAAAQEKLAKPLSPPALSDAVAASAIGNRIHVLGNSSSGKSTLGRRLSEGLGLPLVELDALNWEPDWVGLSDRDPAELERRISDATAGSRWIVAGSYESFCWRAFWPRLQTVIWLDLPMPLLVWRMLKRSWRRWRSRELLWGTNYERFWSQLMFWKKQDSLLWWIVTQHQPKRARLLAAMADPRWAHIRFVRLTRSREVEDFVSALEIGRGFSPADPDPAFRR